MTVKFRAAAAALTLALAASAGAAQAAYPEQAIKIVVPFTPGGATDAVARLLANRLSGKLGQAVIVENRPGASTVIGAEAAARAQPDGYTLMLSGSTTYTVLPALKPGLPYDPGAATNISPSSPWRRWCCWPERCRRRPRGSPPPRWRARAPRAN